MVHTELTYVVAVDDMALCVGSADVTEGEPVEESSKSHSSGGQ